MSAARSIVQQRPSSGPGVLIHSPGWPSILWALLQLSDLCLYLLWLSEVAHEVEIILCKGPRNIR